MIYAVPGHEDFGGDNGHRDGREALDEPLEQRVVENSSRKRTVELAADK